MLVLEKTISNKCFLHEAILGSLKSGFDFLDQNKLKNQSKYFGRNAFLNSVIFEADEKYVGKLVDIKITKINRNTLFGKIDENKKMRAA